MELVFAIAGIVLIWYFASTMKAFASGVEVKAQVIAEQVIAEAVEERTEMFEQHLKQMDGKTTYSHEEIMKHFKV